MSSICILIRKLIKANKLIRKLIKANKLIRNLIKANKKVKGVNIFEHTYLCSFDADNTAFF